MKLCIIKIPVRNKIIVIIRDNITVKLSTQVIFKGFVFIFILSVFTVANRIARYQQNRSLFFKLIVKRV